MERRSCCSLLSVLLLAAVTLGLMGYKHIQMELINKLKSQFKFSEANELKTDLDLTNLDLELQNRQLEMDITNKEVEGLEVEVKKMVLEQQKMENEVKECQGSLVSNEDPCCASMSNFLPQKMCLKM